MFDDLGLRDIVYIFLAIAGGFGAWYALRGRVSALEISNKTLREETLENMRKDISKNDDRSNERFKNLEKDVDELEKKGHSTDQRLTTIEADVGYIKKSVDDSSGDLKTIMNTVTALAAISKTKGGD